METQAETAPGVRYELETSVDWQDAPFTITADYETVKELHDEQERLHARQEGQARKAAARRAVSVAVEAPVEAISSRFEAVRHSIAESVQVRAYDFLNGTNFRRALAEQRQVRKDAVFAAKIGLLTVEPCARHRKALEAVKKIR